MSLDLEQQCHTRKHPLAGVFSSFKVKSPYISWSSLACFVYGTWVHTAGILLVSRNGFDENDRHGRGQFLEPGIRDYPGLQRKEEVSDCQNLHLL